jgi:hypothetical protein
MEHGLARTQAWDSASGASTTRPANEDSAGHWGAKVQNNLQDGHPHRLQRGGRQMCVCPSLAKTRENIGFEMLL